MVYNTLKTGLGSLMVENSNGTSSTASSAGANTDSNLTPTTLKSITQIFESQDCLSTIQNFEGDEFAVPLPVTTASAIPSTKSKAAPVATARRSFFKLDSNAWQGGLTTVVTPTKSEPETDIDLPEPVINPPVPTPVTVPTMTMRTRSSTREQTAYVAKRRHQEEQQPTILRNPEKKKKTVKRIPGRTSRIPEDELTPQEVERLKIRRERNKAAAARCRKRRVDQIESLTAEVEQWEAKKRILEETIVQLRMQKDELEYILTQHRSECKLGMVDQQSLPVAIKSEPVIVEPVEQFYIVQPEPQPFAASQERGGPKPKRPLSLKIAASMVPSGPEGVAIETPSKIVSGLAFDSLMTSTGLTPTSNIVTPVSFSTPSCSSQQRTTELTSTADQNTPSGEYVSL